MSGGIGGLKLDPITGSVISSGDVGTVENTQTGSGIGGTGGTVPDGSSATFNSVVQSLRTMMPNLSSQDFEVLVAQVTAKLKDAMGDVTESRVNNEMEAKRLGIKENEAKIEEAKRKMDEAEAKKKSGNIFDILSMIFQALAAAFMAALGAVLSVLPGGQALGALMIASAVIMAISVINSIVAKANDGAGILGSIAKAAGSNDPNLIMGLDMGFMVGSAVAGIALACFTGGASVSGVIANIVKGISTMVQATLSTIQAANTVISTSIGLAAAVDRKDAAEARADATEVQALMKMLDDLIDQAMQLLMQIKANANAMIDSVTQMLNDTGNTMSNTRFSG